MLVFQLNFCVRRLSSLAFCFLAVASMSIARGDDPVSPSAPQEATESLDVRYARAHLELAKLDLLRALAIEKRTPDVLPGIALENLDRHVAIDQEQLKQAALGGDGNLHEIYLRTAEHSVKTAEADLARKQASFKRMPTDLGALDVKRAAALVKLAKLHLEKTHKQEVSLSSLSYLQWQIDYLRNELLELRVRVETKKDH
jgi:hypothetical protein